MKKALLIIDLQTGLFEQRPFDFSNTIYNVETLIRYANANNYPIIFIQHEQEGSLLEYGSSGWQIIKELSLPPKYHIIRKTTPDSFLDTELNMVLSNHEIQQLIICGYATEFCIDTTVRSAAAHGYNIVLVSDAHTTHDKDHLSAHIIRDHHNRTLSSIRSFGITIKAVKTSEIVKIANGDGCGNKA